MPKPGHDIKDEPLYQALAALGTKHQSMRLETLERYSVILKAPEVLRRAKRQTRFDQLAATAHATIMAAIAEIHDARDNDIAKAVMCALPEYDRVKVKIRRAALEQRYSDIDAEAYKYLRLVILERIYHFLTRPPSPDNDWRASTGWPMHPAGWEVAPELLPTLGRLRFSLARLCYGALGTAFLSRFNDRLQAEGVYVRGSVQPVPRRRYVLSADYEGGRWPVALDLFFEPCVEFILARDAFDDQFDAWRGTYTTVWQEHRLNTRLDHLEQYAPKLREALKEWTTLSPKQRKAESKLTDQLTSFYRDWWFGWVTSMAPRYATSRFSTLEMVASESWELLDTIRDLFGYDPNADQSAHTATREAVLAYYHERLSRSIAVDRKPLSVVIAQYLRRATVRQQFEPLVWHRIEHGTKYLDDVHNRLG